VEKKKQPKLLPQTFYISATSTFAYQDLTSGVGQGIAVYQRIGQSINVSKISLKIILTSADATQVMRVIVFRWLVSDTSDAPATNEIFDTIGGTAPEVVAQTLPYKPSRFAMLWDKTYTFSTNYMPVQHIEHDVKLNTLVQYDVGVSTGKNHVYIAFVSDSVAIPHPTVTYCASVHYHDTE